MRCKTLEHSANHMMEAGRDDRGMKCTHLSDGSLYGHGVDTSH